MYRADGDKQRSTADIIAEATKLSTIPETDDPVSDNSDNFGTGLGLELGMRFVEARNAIAAVAASR